MLSEGEAGQAHPGLRDGPEREQDQPGRGAEGEEEVVEALVVRHGPRAASASS